MLSPETPPQTDDEGRDGGAGNPYVFVVGCPRSGTTLLQRILDHHPWLAVANDTHFIPRCLKALGPEVIAAAKAGEPPPLTAELAAAVRSYHRFPRLQVPSAAVDAAAQRSTYRDFVAELYKQFAHVRGKRWGGEKTPDYVRQLRLLRGLFPWTRFVHIVRDGRDVALSLLEWASPHKGPGRFALWYEEPMAVCALWWRDLVLAAQRDAIAIGKHTYFEVRYEQLVGNPSESVQELCKFLDLPYDERMLSSFGAKTEPALRDRSAKSAWLPPTPGLRDWRTQFHPREKELFQALAGDLLEHLGYEPSAEAISAEVQQRASDCRAWWREHVESRATDSRKSRCESPLQRTNRSTTTVGPHRNLTPPDAELVQRDSALPGLALLLSDNEMAAAVARATWHLDIQSARCRYLRYKPGASCLAAYEFQTSAGVLDGFAMAQRVEEREKLRRILYQRTPSRGHEIAATFLDDQVVIAAPRGYDRLLPSLGNIDSARGRSSLLRRVFAENPSWQHAEITRIRYKPQRRFVARVVVDGVPLARLKLYAEQDYPAVKRAAKSLNSNDVPQAVPLIGRSDRYFALAFAWLDAPSLREHWQANSGDVDIVTDLGAALGEFHVRPCAKLPARHAQTLSEAIHGAAVALNWLCPPLKSQIDSTSHDLLAQLQQTRDVRATLHGDFDASQVLLDASGVKLIDFDRAGRGHPAIDLGNFIADRDADCLAGHIDAAQRDAIAECLVNGYCQAASNELATAVRSEVNVYRAISLFQSAIEAFRNRDPQWPQRIEATLKRVAECVADR
ncbi:MAG: sulfotransferase [Planctomycetales bacterium]|nr:sulfotransferase [Planctomycetales bacterium]